MKQSLIYSSKVWLTTIILGMRVAALIKIGLDTDHLIYSPLDIINSAIYDIPIGLIVCLPSWFLFMILVSYFNKKNIQLIYKKLWLTITAIFLSVLPFAILFWYQLTHINYLPDMLPELIGYTSVTIIGIWVYKMRAVFRIND
jgi:hypothetical protein